MEGWPSWLKAPDCKSDDTVFVGALRAEQHSLGNKHASMFITLTHLLIESYPFHFAS